MKAKLFEPKDNKTNEIVFEAARNASGNWSAVKEDFYNQEIFFWIGIHNLENDGKFHYATDTNKHEILWSNWNNESSSTKGNYGKILTMILQETG